MPDTAAAPEAPASPERAGNGTAADPRGTGRRGRTAHRGRRRTRLAVAVVLLLLLAGLLALVQVRAGQAQGERDAAAAQEAADAEREARATAEAERLAEEDAAAALEAAWDAAVAAAEAQLAQADAVLAGSEGQVADDATRQTLAEAIDAVRLTLTREPAPERLAEAATALAAASAAVTQAQEAWQAAQDALAADMAERALAEAGATEAPAGPTAPDGPTSAGAGPDCGGPESYEPPKNDGSPVFYTSTPSDAGDGSNGRVPASSMSALAWCTDSQGNHQWLRSDAAAALTQLNEAFRAQFGENIAVDMAYRSYADQVAMREHYGTAAARPGTSNHGLGLAIDTWEWRAYSFGSDRYDWLVANGPSFGWVAPSWAREGGSNPEYWHYEFVG